MRTPVVALATLLAATPSFGQEAEPLVRDCSTRAYGDLGRHWTRDAVLAGPLAFVGMRDGYRSVPTAPVGQAWPLKVLVVVEPRAVATVTIAARSRRFAALASSALRHDGRPVPLSSGVPSVRFEACRRANPGRPWNRGTQFPGYVLVAGRGCVGVEVRIQARAQPYRRTLRFGVSRCR